MPEYAKKGIMNHYPKVEDGYSDPECTHIILTKAEYDDMDADIGYYKKIAKDTKEAAQKQLDDLVDRANEKIKEVQGKATAELQTVTDELEQTRIDLEKQKGLNKNLLRIAKERANSDRKLKPKKEHTGYVVLSSRGSDYKYKVNRYTWEITELWETILQTPYRVEFTEEQIRLLIEELFENDNTIIGKIGITEKVIGNYEDIKETPEYIEELQYKNFVMKQQLRANYVTGYWEVILKHTSPLVNVPRDMMHCSYDWRT